MRASDFLYYLISALMIRAGQVSLLTDINQISRYWANLAPYADNPEDQFGVEYTGLPAGCQIESVQTIQRHGDRQSTSGGFDSVNNLRFGRKIADFISVTHSKELFSGPLAFLNSWQPVVDDNGFLSTAGAVTLFDAGVSFWNQYGRTLYNASVGQIAYDPMFPNGTARPPVVLRTTDQSRMHNSQINWANGFFGSTFQPIPNPKLENVTAPYRVVVIPEGRHNNTLASYGSCPNCMKSFRSIGYNYLFEYLPIYLGPATKRLEPFVPSKFNLTAEDVYAMQSLCAYEYAYIRNSEFCNLFTEDEWAGFENAQNMKFYYGSAFGSPSGRARGIGLVEELLARLNHSLIHSSSSSVNVTLDSNEATFPTNQAFYADFSHDDGIIATLTALSIDYFHSPPNVTAFPPKRDENFAVSKIVPFGGRLVTETIGCSSPSPGPRRFPRVQYTPNQYGYDASRASHKFIRMRLNNGILPLSTIRGGACGNDESGRVDGMCALENFLLSQKNSSALANYQYVCFANYTVDLSATKGKDWDGAVFP